MPTIECRYFLASDLIGPVLPNHTFHFSHTLIRTFGELYAGTLIHELGVHYNLYFNNHAFPFAWHIPNTLFTVPPGDLRRQISKERAPDVTGNFGEVLTIPALASSIGVPISALQFQRIFSTRRQCPDFRVSFSVTDINALWGLSLATIPNEFPIEVKTVFGRGYNGFPINALEQLCSYWDECLNHGYVSTVGFGVVTQANIAPSTQNIRYYLFVPQRTLTNADIDDIRQKLRNVPTSRRRFYSTRGRLLRRRKRQYIQALLRRYFR